MKLSAIERDQSIQCRASLDIATVNEYAERMTAGDTFPPVVVFGTGSRAWVGDGWHRIAASDQIGALDIDAEIRPGGRIDALKYALGVNATHGLKRSNADKRRCVEIALREFPKLSNRAIAEMCGVSDEFVRQQRQVPTVGTSTVTGADGKQYPARRQKVAPQESPHPISVGVIEHNDPPPARQLGPACMGLKFARLAIMNLEQIQHDDTERNAAFNKVREWINEQQN